MGYWVAHHLRYKLIELILILVEPSVGTLECSGCTASDSWSHPLFIGVELAPLFMDDPVGRVVYNPTFRWQWWDNDYFAVIYTAKSYNQEGPFGKCVAHL